MREVYDTREIAHLWAHQSQPSARNQQGNFSFAATELRSYSTTIAILARNGKGETAVFALDRTYSATTNRHQSLMRQATSHLPLHAVVELPRNRADRDAHAANLRYFAERAGECIDKADRARANGPWHVADALRWAAQHNAYLTFFKLRYKPLSADFQVLSADRADRVNAHAARVIREDKVRAKTRAAAAAEQSRVEQAALLAWLDGAPHEYDLPRDYPHLRIVVGGNNVETTFGATVPLAHVARLMPFVLRKLDRHESWDARTDAMNARPERLGVFTLDRIEQDGTVVCGCHRFPPEEIRRFATIMPEPALTT